MCDKCGIETRDILVRAISYGGIRFLEGIDGPKALVEGVSDAVGLQSEKKHDPMKIAAKTAINALVDYGYDKFIYEKWKPQMNPMIGLCPCELMKALWQLLAQIIYEWSMNDLRGEAVLKDIVAIYAQFPISNFLKKSM